MDVADDCPGHTLRVEEPPGAATGEIDSSSPVPEDTGLSPDGRWFNDAAYDWRFCLPDHGELEYFLGPADRWLSPAELEIPDAETVLDDMLHKNRNRPSQFDPHLRPHQAECRGVLYSQLYSVLQKREHSGWILFQVQGRPSWIPANQLVGRTLLRRYWKRIRTCTANGVDEQDPISQTGQKDTRRPWFW